MPRKRKHFVIPDTQLKPGVSTDHLEAAGRYIADHASSGDALILLGDWYDMPSLSSYDNPGDTNWEEKDVNLDFQAGLFGLMKFHQALKKKAKLNGKGDLWDKLVKHALMGNHEDRVRRVREMAEYRRFASQALHDDNFAFKDFGFKTHKFLHYLKLDGILYSHYFVNPESKTGNPISGTMHNKLNKLKVSNTSGHTQGLDLAMQYTADGRRLRGLMAGSFYMHDEDYMGPQKNRQHWRGIIVKHEVYRGDYDLMEVSMNYLLENYT